MIWQQQIEEHSLTWGEIWGFLLKYKILIVTITVVGVVGTWFALQVFFTELYESQAKLLVKLGRENVEPPTTVKHGQVFSQGVRVADINSEVQILSSRALIEAVVDELGPDRFKSVLKSPESIWGYPKYYIKRVMRWAKGVYKEFLILTRLKKRLSPREEAIKRLDAGVKVEPVRESDILVLKVRTPSPQLCVDAAESMLRHYLEMRVEARRTSAGADFFRARLEEIRRQLEELRARRAAVRQQWDLDSAEEQRSLWLRQVADFETEVARNLSEIQRLERQQAVIRTELERLPNLLPKEQVKSRNPSIQSLKERITQLELERARLINRYLPESETVRKLDTELAALREMLQQEQATILSSETSEANPVRRRFLQQLEEIRVEIAGLVARNQQLRKHIAELEANLDRINEGADLYEAVEREYRLAEENFSFYAKRLEEARMSEQLDAQRVANVSVASPPEFPIEPVYPKKLFLVGISIPVSLILGIGLAALIETMDDRLFSERDLDRTEEWPYLGVVQVKSKTKGTARAA